MDKLLVFARTSKGEEEFQHRTFHLNQVLRRVLILIDGKSSVAQLIERGIGLSDVPTALQILASEGFINTAEEASRSGQEVRDPQQAIIELAQSLLGTQGAKVVKKIEDAGKGLESLASAVDASRKLIKLFIDESKSDEFARRAKEILYASGR